MPATKTLLWCYYSYVYVYIVSLRAILKMSACALAVAVLAAKARAIAPDPAPVQYQSITERNVFGLHAPPTQAPPTNAPPQLSKITLTGITTILGNKRALMKVLPIALKPGDAAKELSLILTEGQRESEIEVLQIDELAGRVKVNNAGTVMILTFEKDGSKLPATPGPAAIPNAPSPLPVAGVTNPYIPAPTPAATARRFPGRNPRLPMTPPLPGVTGAAAATPVGGVPTPTGLVPTPVQTASPAEQEITAEEQAIVQEIQRQVNANSPNNVGPTPTGAQPTDIGTPISGANLPVPARPPTFAPQ